MKKVDAAELLARAKEVQRRLYAEDYDEILSYEDLEYLVQALAVDEGTGNEDPHPRYAGPPPEVEANGGARVNIIDVLAGIYNAGRAKRPGYVYAAEYDDGIIKVGSTNNFERRKYTLKNHRNKKHQIVRTFVSDYIEDALGSERATQNRLTPYIKEIAGELYTNPFEEVVQRIKEITRTENGVMWDGRPGKDVTSSDAPEEG